MKTKVKEKSFLPVSLKVHVLDRNVLLYKFGLRTMRQSDTTVPERHAPLLVRSFLDILSDRPIRVSQALQGDLDLLWDPVRLAGCWQARGDRVHLSIPLYHFHQGVRLFLTNP